MTAFEPGASDVLTVGCTRMPRATASSPAPTMTVGFEVFVHDVIAAIATDRVWIVASWSSTTTRTGRYSRRSTTGSRGGGLPGRAVVGGSASRRRPGALNDVGSLAGNDSAEASSTVPWTGVGSPAASSATGPSSPSGKFDRKFARRSCSGTRSCGRRGPATDGMTVARSSSRSASKSGPGPGSRQSPWDFAYRSTRSMRSAVRPVSRR